MSRRARILAVYHDYNWEAANLGPGIAEIADVVHADWHHPEDSRMRLRDARGARHRRILDAYERALSTGPVDAVFTYLSGEQVEPRTIESLRAARVPLINMSLNDRESFVGKVVDGVACGMRDIAPLFDLCWTSTGSARHKYVVEGAVPVWMPEGANPSVHRPLGLDRDLDVAFVGQRYGNRPTVVRALERSGVAVRAYGQGWPDGALSVVEMVRVWNRAKIVLGFSGVLGHCGTFCLKGRDFEVPMSGACYLTEHHQELECVYEVGIEVLAYQGIRDLMDMIPPLLKDAGRLEQVRMSGVRRARRDHSWGSRFRRAFQLVGLM